MSKSIIVTGASNGIGKDIAINLAKLGNNVIINYNNSEKEAIKLKEELKDYNVEIYKADVSNRKEVKKMVEFTIDKFKKIDVLINNAGISSFNLFTEITDEEWNNVINKNLYSVFCTTQEVLKNMINNKSGLIINISSIWGITGASCEVSYSVSKAGIDGMTKSLAKELGLSNIRVNSIAPGIINTRMNEKLTQEEKNEIKNQIPLNKIGEPNEISKCVEWLIKDTYTTGQVISINGGWLI